MGNRRGGRRQQQPSAMEVAFAAVAIIFILIFLSGVSSASVIKYMLTGLGILVFVGFVAWFVRGLFKPTKPINSKSINLAKDKPAPTPFEFTQGKTQPITKVTEVEQAVATEWDEQLIAALEWRVFEKLCVKLWQAKGFEARASKQGADGGVDLYLYAKSTNQKIGLIQCKSWSKKRIGVKVVRELQGVVTGEELKLGLLMYSGRLSKDAITFLSKPAVTVKAQGNAEILSELQKLAPSEQQRLLSELTLGEYKRPSCPTCDVKLVQRQSGDNGKFFWGCSNFPRCRFVLHDRALNKA